VISGAGAGWTFQLDGDWEAGDYLEISVAPNSYPIGIAGVNCATPYFPPGVNEEQWGLSNYIGFSAVNEGATEVESEWGGGGAAPTFDVSVEDVIECSQLTGTNSYNSLRLTLTNSGNGNAAQKATVRVGWSTNPPPYQANPVLFDVGFGTPVGPAFFSGVASPGGAFAVDSTVTVVGQTPSANNPRDTLVRNTASDNVSGAISEFKITENVPHGLPPLWVNGTVTLLNENDPGSVCLEIRNTSVGNELNWASVPGWAVDIGASAASNSAAAGPRPVVLESGPEGIDTILRLPVESASNKTPTVWTT
jgi:hypothetical protein